MTPKQRFAQMIRAIEKAPPEQFDMSSWIEGTPRCFTAACALGWAAMDPKLKAEGLKFYGNTPFFRTRRGLGRGFGAAQLFFDISCKDADRLFEAVFYRKPFKPNVLRRLRAFLKRWEQRAQ